MFANALRRSGGWPLVILVTAAAGCGKSSVDMRMDGEVRTVVRLEGPVQVVLQMKGPTIVYRGTYISDELFARVKVGEATGEWVLAVLGEPTGKSALKDGSEIWKWTYEPVEQESAMVQVFGGSEKEPKLATRAVFLHLSQGVVRDKWKG